MKAFRALIAEIPSMAAVAILALAMCSLVFPVAAQAPSQAQEKTTVQSLLKERYLIVGTVPSSAGPGLFLRKRDKLYLCFVAETPTSATVATQYCKPVE